MGGMNHSPDQSDVVNLDFDHVRASVTTTASEAKVGGSRMANRQELIIYNDGSKTVFWGKSSVTSSGSTKGIPIPPKGVANIQAGESLAVFLITASSTSNVIIQEWA